MIVLLSSDNFVSFIILLVYGDPFLYHRIVDAGCDSAVQANFTIDWDSVRFCCAAKL